MNEHPRNRYHELALEVARRAGELIPALPRPLFGNPRFRILIDQQGSCIALHPISRDYLLHEPVVYLRRPPRHHLAAVVTCLDRDGRPHGGLGPFPFALHCAAMIHDSNGPALLPPVLASLFRGLGSLNDAPNHPYSLTTSLNLYASAA